MADVLAQGPEPGRRRPWPARWWAVGAAGLLAAAVVAGQTSGDRSDGGRAALVVGVRLAGGNAALADIAGDVVVRVDVVGAPPGTRIELAELRLAGVRVDRVLAPAFDPGGLSTVRLVLAVDCPVALPGLERGVLELRLARPGGAARTVRLPVQPGGRRTIFVQAVQTHCRG